MFAKIREAGRLLRSIRPYMAAFDLAAESRNEEALEQLHSVAQLVDLGRVSYVSIKCLLLKSLLLVLTEQHRECIETAETAVQHLEQYPRLRDHEREYLKCYATLNARDAGHDVWEDPAFLSSWPVIDMTKVASHWRRDFPVPSRPDWRDMEEFEGIYLEDCFVFSWEETEVELSFHILASLWSGHPEYAKPKPDEWTCYKEAALVFLGKKTVSGLRSMNDVRPTTDLDGSVDYGTLDTLALNPDGSYFVSGEFGDVTIECAGFVIQFS